MHLRIETVVEPPGSGTDRFWGNQLGGGFAYDAGKEHRVLWDAATRTYFGYDLTVERADKVGSCRVTILPLSQTMEDVAAWGRGAPRMDATGYRALALPTYPAPHTVRADDAIALELLVSADGKHKVVDYLHVSCKGQAVGGIGGTQAPLGGIAGSPPPARDFSAQDVELRVVEPKVVVSGGSSRKLDLRGETSGSTLWFYIPGKGRFLVSLVPYPNLGFAPNGTLRGSTISFEHGSDHYEIRSSEPMFRSGKVWNLYLRAEPAHQSGQGAAFGSSDRPEHILK